MSAADPVGYRYVSHKHDAFVREVMPWSDVPENRPVVRERCAVPGCEGRTSKVAATLPPLLAPLCQRCRADVAPARRAA